MSLEKKFKIKYHEGFEAGKMAVIRKVLSLLEEGLLTKRDNFDWYRELNGVKK